VRKSAKHPQNRCLFRSEFFLIYSEKIEQSEPRFMPINLQGAANTVRWRACERQLPGTRGNRERKEDAYAKTKQENLPLPGPDPYGNGNVIVHNGHYLCRAVAAAKDNSE
jgi:hypothetical protein